MIDDNARLREKRSSVILNALVRTTKVPEGVERRVRNLSASGACIDHMGELAPGETLVLVMGSLNDVDARVAWATHRLAGVQFEREVDLEAARMRRDASVAPKSGWMAEMNHAYRKVS